MSSHRVRFIKPFICLIAILLLQSPALAGPLNLDQISQDLKNPDGKVRIEALLRLRSSEFNQQEEVLGMVMNHLRGFITRTEEDAEQYDPNVFMLEDISNLLDEWFPFLSLEESVTGFVAVETITAHLEKNLPIFEQFFQDFFSELKNEDHSSSSTLLQNIFDRVAEVPEAKERLKKTHNNLVRAKLADNLGAPPYSENAHFIFETISSAARRPYEETSQSFIWLRGALLSRPLIDFEGRPLEPELLDDLLNLESSLDQGFSNLLFGLNIVRQTGNSELTNLNFKRLTSYCNLLSYISAILGRIERAHEEGAFSDKDKIYDDTKIKRMRGKIISNIKRMMASFEKNPYWDNIYRNIYNEAVAKNLPNEEPVPEFYAQLFYLRAEIVVTNSRNEIDDLARTYMQLSPREREKALKESTKVLERETLSFLIHSINRFGNDRAFETVMYNESCANIWRTERN